MAEHVTGHVKISGISNEVFAALLEYIYTATCPNLLKLAEPILEAADRYMLTELKNQCELQLTKQRLTFGNIIDKLKFADLYSLKNLKNKCMIFIMQNLSSH